MVLVLSSFAVGVLFGLGLSISEMINPSRVIGFLDVTGRWDPTLVLVMAGALVITVTMFPLISRRPVSLLGQKLVLPVKTKLDLPLVLGAAIFGIGWGLGGLCPGPALAGLASGSLEIVLFVAAMVAGQWLAGRVEIS
jgi:uncharacterized membrane protein YedE/YeeE